MILDLALTFATGCFALALVLNLWRLATARDLVDRVLAVDTMAVNVAALLVLFAAQARAFPGLEVALLIAMSGFVGTVAFCRHILRGSIIE